MHDLAGNFYMVDDMVYSKDSSIFSPAASSAVVYEVIRIIDGTPLFFNDHFERMEKSFLMLGTHLNILKEDLDAKISKLININSNKNCNVKVMVSNNDVKQVCLVYISKSYYPVQKEIESGVKVDFFSTERSDPNIKKINLSYKEQLDNFIKENNLFEALLVNRHDEITEGSKSNVFFARGNSIITAPDEVVLQGITRKYILDVCSDLNLSIIKKKVHIDDLLSMDGLFLSGTSIKVLPVSHVGKLTFNSAQLPVINNIRRNFDLVIERDLSHKRDNR